MYVWARRTSFTVPSWTSPLFATRYASCKVEATIACVSSAEDLSCSLVPSTVYPIQSIFYIRKTRGTHDPNTYLMSFDMRPKLPVPQFSPFVHLGAVSREYGPVDDQCWRAEVFDRRADIFRCQLIVQATSRIGIDERSALGGELVRHCRRCVVQVIFGGFPERFSVLDFNGAM